MIAASIFGRLPSGCLYKDSNSWDNVTNDYVTITFSGTQIAFYSVLDPWGGIEAISIDGGSETNIDT